MFKDKVYTRDVLKLIGVGGIVITSVLMPNLPIALAAAYKQWKDFNKRDLGKVIKRLQKQQMINVNEEESMIKILITDKGKKRLLQYDYENLQIKAKKRDGKWRVVIFDIPEQKKKSREAFRKKLVEMGFLRLQDSVFANAFSCKDEIDFLCHFLEISDYVTVLGVDKIERGEQLIFQPLFTGHR